MSVLEGREPQAVLHYFEEICAIPHGSGNTRQISDYLAAFAKAHGLFCVQDASNNIIIKKPRLPDMNPPRRSSFRGIWTWCASRIRPSATLI